MRFDLYIVDFAIEIERVPITASYIQHSNLVTPRNETQSFGYLCFESVVANFMQDGIRIRLFLQLLLVVRVVIRRVNSPELTDIRAGIEIAKPTLRASHH